LNGLQTLDPRLKSALDYIAPSETPGITKGLGFKTQWFAIETRVVPLPMSLTWGCQWLVWLGLLLCYQENKIPLSSIRQLLGSRLHVSFLQHFLVLWLPWFGGKKQPSNYQCWVVELCHIDFYCLWSYHPNLANLGHFSHEKPFV
jgi:hypothetical protein